MCSLQTLLYGVIGSVNLYREVLIQVIGFCHGMKISSTWSPGVVLSPRKSVTLHVKDGMNLVLIDFQQIPTHMRYVSLPFSALCEIQNSSVV